MDPYCSQAALLWDLTSCIERTYTHTHVYTHTHTQAAHMHTSQQGSHVFECEQLYQLDKGAAPGAGRDRPGPALGGAPQVYNPAPDLDVEEPCLSFHNNFL